jgi:hypothetical protein
MYAKPALGPVQDGDVDMALRTMIEFKADFPDDAVYDEEDNTLVQGGKNVLSHVRSKLEPRGVKCSEIEPHSFYGWSFNCELDRRRFWCLIQGGDPWLLICQGRRSFADWLFRKHHTTEHRKLLHVIHEVLNDDEHFGEMTWYEEQEYNSSKDAVGSDGPE